MLAKSRRLLESFAGADSVFPVGGDVNPSGGGGAPRYDFAKISEKLHKVETILGRKGEGIRY